MKSLAFASATPSRATSATSTPSALDKTVEQLSQTVALMTANDPDGFYDIAQRDKLYARVDAQNGAMLLEKIDRGREEAEQREAKEAAAAIAASTGDAPAGTSAVAGSGAASTATITSAGETGKSKISERFGSAVRGLRRVGEGEKGQ